MEDNYSSPLCVLRMQDMIPSLNKLTNPTTCMPSQKHWLAYVLILLLTACGQKGPLYLPDPNAPHPTKRVPS